VEDLHSLGVTSGDILLVHSSYRATGKAAGGPVGFIEALLEAIGPAGTLLMPNLNIPGPFTVENPPCFDVEGGHIGDKLGIVPQTFKERFATHFSLHPTHSMMGRGPAAREILSGHEAAGTCCGPATPWETYARMGGKTLLVGVTQACNTTYHCAEESLPDTYKLTRAVVRGKVIAGGREVPVPSRLHLWGKPADFGILNDELARNGWLARGKVGLADSMLIQAGPFLDLAAEKLRIDPHYFLVNKG